jgi:penicillin-binding protein 1A
MPVQPNTRPAEAAHLTRTFLRIGGWLLFGLAGLLVAGLLAAAVATTLAYRNLPPIDILTDYRPKVPLRVFTSDNVLIGEFGEERRNLVRINDVPLIMKQAILAAEDDRFYQHSGIDMLGIIRSAITNLVTGSAFGSGHRVGASTITQQVARTFFLSSEQTYNRKFYEVLLAFKIEESLTKDQIFEVYINQIYLGQRAYGFASAARVYFGKALRDIDVAEAAMLAGIPKAPSAYNPVVNPPRAKLRQQYVLNRMLSLGFLTEAQYREAQRDTPVVKESGTEFATHAEYVAEMARQAAYDQFKDETYRLGLNVYTTLVYAEQNAAYQALRSGALDYERRHGYGGPEAYVDLPKSADRRSKSETDAKELNQAVEDALLEYSDNDDIVAAVVLDASPKLVRASRQGDEIQITGDGLKFAANSLGDKVPQNRRIRRGAIIRLVKNSKGTWEIIQLPSVQSAFVSANVQDGAIRALVGGFDYSRSKFNHVVQAWRQPGSSFKPFIYSAALEKGFTPATVINDAPFVATSAVTGGQDWEPKNYDGKYEGPMTIRRALAKSKNMVSIRILQAIGPKYAQDYIARFGFDPEKHPAYLTMALGSGSVTPWQMVGAFSVFANGGYKINPYIIDRITDSSGKVVAQARQARAGDEGNRVVDVRNAFIMDSLLRDVVRYGTAARAGTLKRGDLAGKTGTTNDSHDAWFAGYSNDNMVGVAWMGFDQPKSLGDRETGGGLALPIWIAYMSSALRDVPEKPRKMPEGVVNVDGEFYYVENQPRKAVESLDLGGALSGTVPSPEPEPEPAQ